MSTRRLRLPAFAIAALAFGLTAVAGEPPAKPAAAAEASKDASSEATTIAKKAQTTSAKDDAAAKCASTTGTRIKPKPPNRCNQSNVTTYTQEELQRTGEIDTGKALQQLDPRFQ